GTISSCAAICKTGYADVYTISAPVTKCSASGTEVIEEFGAEHLETGALIVYTSADPVLQIAAHEDIVPLEELYEICEKVREMTLHAPYKVGRIIARPFDGGLGAFERRNNHRHDYALSPFDRT